MQRTISKPSLTWLLLIALLVGSGVLTAVRGLGAAENVAACTGYGYGSGYGYASPAPKLTLTLAVDVQVSGRAVTATGQLTQAGCVLPNQRVIVKRRNVVAGIPRGSFVTYTTVRTNAAGIYTLPITLIYNSVIQASAPGAGGRPAVNSPARVLRLFARVGALAPPGTHLRRARICGRVTPSHAGTVLVLYRGINRVWVPQQAKRVLSDNSYCFALLLPRGRTPIKIRLYTTDTNLFGQRSFYATRT